MIHVTLLNPSFDLIYTIPEAGRETYVDLPTHLFPAGKGLNVAKVIAKLGEPVKLLSLMPENDRSRFANYCDERGIEHESFPIHGSVRINTTIFEESSRSTVHYNSAVKPLTTQVQDHFEMFLRNELRAGDQWIFSGSLPKGVEPDFYARMIETCREKGVEPFLDTRGTALELGICERPVVLSPNVEELESLFKEPIDGVQHLALKGKRLIDRGIENLFITLGEDGVIAMNRDECLLCRAPEITVVDTVGCGDAFLAGVAVGRSRGFSFYETCRLAVACGTSNAANFGPGEVDSDQVWHFMEKISVAQL